MTALRTAAKQALEALEQSETFVPYEGFGMARREAERKHQAAITALRAALAEPVQDGKCKHCVDGCPACDARKLPVQEPVACSNTFGCRCPKHFTAEPVQEPVAWLIEYENDEREVRFVAGTRGMRQTPLYTAR